MKERQRAKSERTREAIISAAEEEFAEKGFFGARVDAIATAAGVNKRMIYAHFESKDGLYSKVLSSVYARLAECERRFMVDGVPVKEAIRNIISVSFDFLMEDSSFVRILMWENLNLAKSIPADEVVRLKAPTLEYMTSVIRRGKNEGIFKNEIDEEQTVLSLMSFCFAYFSNIHTMSKIFKKDMTKPEEVKARAEYISDMLLSYLSFSSGK